MTSEEFDDFDSWWADEGDWFVESYRDWMNDEGNSRLDIYWMYEWPWTDMVFDIGAAKVGGREVRSKITMSPERPDCCPVIESLNPPQKTPLAQAAAPTSVVVVNAEPGMTALAAPGEESQPLPIPNCMQFLG